MTSETTPGQVLTDLRTKAIGERSLEEQDEILDQVKALKVRDRENGFPGSEMGELNFVVARQLKMRD